MLGKKKKDKKDNNWPGLQYEVSVPQSCHVYHPNLALSEQQQLLDSVILDDKDPRQSAVLPTTSIYCRSSEEETEAGSLQSVLAASKTTQDNGQDKSTTKTTKSRAIATLTICLKNDLHEEPEGPEESAKHETDPVNSNDKKQVSCKREPGEVKEGGSQEMQTEERGHEVKGNDNRHANLDASQVNVKVESTEERSCITTSHKKSGSEISHDNPNKNDVPPQPKVKKSKTKATGSNQGPANVPQSQPKKLKQVKDKKSPCVKADTTQHAPKGRDEQSRSSEKPEVGRPHSAHPASKTQDSEQHKNTTKSTKSRASANLTVSLKNDLHAEPEESAKHKRDSVNPNDKKHVLCKEAQPSGEKGKALKGVQHKERGHEVDDNRRAKLDASQVNVKVEPNMEHSCITTSHARAGSEISQDNPDVMSSGQHTVTPANKNDTLLPSKAKKSKTRTNSISQGPTNVPQGPVKKLKQAKDKKNTLHAPKGLAHDEQSPLSDVKPKAVGQTQGHIHKGKHSLASQKLASNADAFEAVFSVLHKTRDELSKTVNEEVGKSGTPPVKVKRQSLTASSSGNDGLVDSKQSKKIQAKATSTKKVHEKQQPHKRHRSRPLDASSDMALEGHAHRNMERSSGDGGRPSMDRSPENFIRQSLERSPEKHRRQSLDWSPESKWKESIERSTEDCQSRPHRQNVDQDLESKASKLDKHGTKSRKVKKRRSSDTHEKLDGISGMDKDSCRKHVDKMEKRKKSMLKGLNPLDKGKPLEYSERMDEQFNHFEGLSLGTQLENSFAPESNMVRRARYDVLKEWLTNKPLDSYIAGKCSNSDLQVGGIQPSLKVDKIVQECLTEFGDNVFDLLIEEGIPVQYSDVIPKARKDSHTTDTVDKVFHQVDPCIDFSVSKSEQSDKTGIVFNGCNDELETEVPPSPPPSPLLRHDRRCSASSAEGRDFHNSYLETERKGHKSTRPKHKHKKKKRKHKKSKSPAKEKSQVVEYYSAGEDKDNSEPISSKEKQAELPVEDCYKDSIEPCKDDVKMSMNQVEETMNSSPQHYSGGEDKDVSESPNKEKPAALLEDCYMPKNAPTKKKTSTGAPPKGIRAQGMTHIMDEFYGDVEDPMNTSDVSVDGIEEPAHLPPVQGLLAETICKDKPFDSIISEEVTKTKEHQQDIPKVPDATIKKTREPLVSSKQAKGGSESLLISTPKNTDCSNKIIPVPTNIIESCKDEVNIPINEAGKSRDSSPQRYSVGEDRDLSEPTNSEEKLVELPMEDSYKPINSPAQQKISAGAPPKDVIAQRMTCIMDELRGDVEDPMNTPDVSVDGTGHADHHPPSVEVLLAETFCKDKPVDSVVIQGVTKEYQLDTIKVRDPTIKKTSEALVSSQQTKNGSESLLHLTPKTKDSSNNVDVLGNSIEPSKEETKMSSNQVGESKDSDRKYDSASEDRDVSEHPNSRESKAELPEDDCSKSINALTKKKTSAGTTPSGISAQETTCITDEFSGYGQDPLNTPDISVDKTELAGQLAESICKDKYADIISQEVTKIKEHELDLLTVPDSEVKKVVPDTDIIEQCKDEVKMSVSRNLTDSTLAPGDKLKTLCASEGTPSETEATLSPFVKRDRLGSGSSSEGGDYNNDSFENERRDQKSARSKHKLKKKKRKHKKNKSPVKPKKARVVTVVEDDSAGEERDVSETANKEKPAECPEDDCYKAINAPTKKKASTSAPPKDISAKQMTHIVDEFYGDTEDPINTSNASVDGTEHPDQHLPCLQGLLAETICKDKCVDTVISEELTKTKKPDSTVKNSVELLDSPKQTKGDSESNLNLTLKSKDSSKKGEILRTITEPCKDKVKMSANQVGEARDSSPDGKTTPVKSSQQRSSSKHLTKAKTTSHDKIKGKASASEVTSHDKDASHNDQKEYQTVAERHFSRSKSPAHYKCIKRKYSPLSHDRIEPRHRLKKLAEPVPLKPKTKVHDFYDSFSSTLGDPYRNTPVPNFEPLFDITKAPEGHFKNPYNQWWSIMQYFLHETRTNTDMRYLENAIPRWENVLTSGIMPENSFLLALSLATNKNSFAYSVDKQIETDDALEFTDAGGDNNEYGSVPGTNNTKPKGTIQPSSLESINNITSDSTNMDNSPKASSKKTLPKRVNTLALAFKQAVEARKLAGQKLTVAKAPLVPLVRKLPVNVKSSLILTEKETTTPSQKIPEPKMEARPIPHGEEDFSKLCLRTSSSNVKPPLNLSFEPELNIRIQSVIADAMEEFASNIKDTVENSLGHQKWNQSILPSGSSSPENQIHHLNPLSDQAKSMFEEIREQNDWRLTVAKTSVAVQTDSSRLPKKNSAAQSIEEQVDTNNATLNESSEKDPLAKTPAITETFISAAMSQDHMEKAKEVIAPQLPLQTLIGPLPLDQTYAPMPVDAPETFARSQPPAMVPHPATSSVAPLQMTEPAPPFAVNHWMASVPGETRSLIAPLPASTPPATDSAYPQQPTGIAPTRPLVAAHPAADAQPAPKVDMPSSTMDPNLALADTAAEGQTVQNTLTAKDTPDVGGSVATPAKPASQEPAKSFPTIKFNLSKSKTTWSKNMPKPSTSANTSTGTAVSDTVVGALPFGTAEPPSPAPSVSTPVVTSAQIPTTTDTAIAVATVVSTDTPVVTTDTSVVTSTQISANTLMAADNQVVTGTPVPESTVVPRNGEMYTPFGEQNLVEADTPSGAHSSVIGLVSLGPIDIPGFGAPEEAAPSAVCLKKYPIVTRELITSGAFPVTSSSPTDAATPTSVCLDSIPLPPAGTVTIDSKPLNVSKPSNWEEWKKLQHLETPVQPNVTPLPLPHLHGNTDATQPMSAPTKPPLKSASDPMPPPPLPPLAQLGLGVTPIPAQQQVQQQQQPQQLQQPQQEQPQQQQQQYGGWYGGMQYQQPWSGGWNPRGPPPSHMGGWQGGYQTGGSPWRHPPPRGWGPWGQHPPPGGFRGPRHQYRHRFPPPHWGRGGQHHGNNRQGGGDWGGQQYHNTHSTHHGPETGRHHSPPNDPANHSQPQHPTPHVGPPYEEQSGECEPPVQEPTMAHPVGDVTTGMGQACEHPGPAAELTVARRGDGVTPGMRPQPAAVAQNIRMLVFNETHPICKSVKDFLTALGAKAFDPYNVSTLQAMQDNETMVLIHVKDIPYIHQVPNLLKLKTQDWVQFLSYQKLRDVQHKTYTVILKGGGIAVPDDNILLAMEPSSLEKICGFLMRQWQEDCGEAWYLVVRSCVFTEMQEEREDERIQQLYAILTQYEEEGVVHVLHGEEFDSTPMPAHEYLSLMLDLQAEYAQSNRHVILLTEMPESDKRAAPFLAHGVSMMNMSSFMRVIVGMPVLPTTIRPRPYYGRKARNLYLDSPVTTAVDVLPPMAVKCLVAGALD